MPGAFLWAWDPDNEKFIKVLVDDTGRLEMSIVIARLDDIADVNVPAPGDDEVLYWDDAAGEWKVKAMPVAAHKDTHDPIDGSDKLDSAAPVKVGSANAIGSSHSLARADHVHEREHAKTVDASELTAGELPTARLSTNVKTLTITFIIDGGGSAITTGEKGHLRIPFNCALNRVTMLADQSGSIVVDIWMDTYANSPPDNADSITSATPPTISTAQKSEDSTLSGWTTTIPAGSILAFNVDSCTTITRVTISLRVTKQ